MRQQKKSNFESLQPQLFQFTPFSHGENQQKIHSKQKKEAKKAHPTPQNHLHSNSTTKSFQPQKKQTKEDRTNKMSCQQITLDQYISKLNQPTSLQEMEQSLNGSVYQLSEFDNNDRIIGLIQERMEQK